jgi:hypothetical protein
MGRAITGGKVSFPKGVFFFKSFEEADAWEMKHILQNARTKSLESRVSKT